MIQQYDNGDTSVESQIINFDTSSITDMNKLFANKPYALGISGWDTSNVTNMNSMFKDNGSPDLIDLSSWDVSKVTDFTDFATNSTAFDSINKIPHFVLHPSTKAELRASIDKYEQNAQNSAIDIALTRALMYADTSAITDMSELFKNDNLGYFDFDISRWNTANVTNMKSMFQGAVYNGSDGNPLNLSNWDVSHVTNIESMFEDSSIVPNINSWNTANITNMNSVFKNNSSAFNTDLSGWNVSKVTDFTDFAYNSTSFLMETVPHFSLRPTTKSELKTVIDRYLQNRANNEYDFSYAMKRAIQYADTSAITDMSELFKDNPGKMDIDISGWDTSNVTTMRSMFDNANTGSTDVSGWDVSNVTDMHRIFASINLGEIMGFQLHPRKLTKSI